MDLDTLCATKKKQEYSWDSKIMVCETRRSNLQLAAAADNVRRLEPRVVETLLSNRIESRSAEQYENAC